MIESEVVKSHPSISASSTALIVSLIYPEPDDVHRWDGDDATSEDSVHAETGDTCIATRNVDICPA